MNLKIAKILCRVIGTLAGLMGLAYVCMVGFFVLDLAKQPQYQGRSIIFCCFFLALSAYFLFVGGLVWRKFSPSAVRHTLFIVAVALWSSLPRSLEQRIGEDAYAFLYLGTFILLFHSYRWLSRKIIVRIFPESLESGNCL